SSIRLQHPYVSRHHARIETRDGDLVFVDLDSRNGSLLNGVRVKGAARLHAGDEIAIGDATMHCAFGAPVPAGTAALARRRGATRLPSLKDVLGISDVPNMVVLA